MSLAAIPVYVLGRRLGLGRGLSLGAAALAVLAPDFLYASFIASEPIAYPLLLAAVAAGVCALAKPTRRSQLAFVAFAGLATFARLQFAVLPIVFLAATLLMGLQERAVRRSLRSQLLPLGLLFVPLLGLATVPAFALGQYRGGLAALHVHPLATLRWAGLDTMLLAYSSGWIIVPGALLGLWLAFRRPRSREELAFAALTVFLLLFLLAEAGTIQSGLGNLNEIEERYVFYLIPLLGLLFALYASRGWPMRMPHLAIAVALLVVSVRIPLAGYAIPARISGAPLLFGLAWLTDAVGQAGSASLAIAAGVALFSAVAVVGSRRPRLGTPLVLGLACAAMAAASAGAVAFDVTNTRVVLRTFLPGNPSWVDESGLRHVALLQSGGDLRGDALEQLFWNRSVDRLLLLPGAAPVDSFAYAHVTVRDDGSLSAGGKTVTTPLLVDGYGSTVLLRNARRVGSSPMRTLWEPTGTPRLALYAIGRYYDGWLSSSGGIYLWPAAKGAPLEGVLSMTIDAPSAGSVRFEGPQGRSVVRLRAGERRTVRLRACAEGPWYATFRSTIRGLVGLRLVSVRSSTPVFTPSPGVCSGAGALHRSVRS
jgi:hypothetical protein